MTTTSDDRLARVLELIDAANSEDPNAEESNGTGLPRALLYGRRMSLWLAKLHPEADEILQIAARGQHIRRWEVPRNSYPPTREGYLRWRTFLYGFHADCLAEVMALAGYGSRETERVRRIASKRGLKTDPDVQAIEDVACLVFLESYFPDFAVKADPEKLSSIAAKTWRKMSEIARAKASEIEFGPELRAVLKRALESV